MEIEFEPVRNDTPNRGEFMIIYLSSFPPNEIIDFDSLIDMTKKGASLDLIRSSGKAIGMRFTFSTDIALFIGFFAIGEGCRSHGYGGAVLNKIYSENEGKTVYLNVEPLDADCHNLEQRKARVRFYERNGLSMIGYMIDINNDTYSVMSSDPSVGIGPYVDLIKAIGMDWKVYRKHRYRQLALVQNDIAAVTMSIEKE